MQSQKRNGHDRRNLEFFCLLCEGGGAVGTEELVPPDVLLKEEVADGGLAAVLALVSDLVPSMSVTLLGGLGGGGGWLLRRRGGFGGPNTASNSRRFSEAVLPITTVSGCQVNTAP